MAVSAQGSLTEGHAQGAVPMRAFSIQFLSLILIILTFTIGVFAAHRIDGDKRKAAQPAVVIQKPATLFPDQFAEQKTAAIGAMNLETLFDMGTSDLNSVMIDSISEVLLAHDIEAKFVV